MAKSRSQRRGEIEHAKHRAAKRGERQRLRDTLNLLAYPEEDVEEGIETPATIKLSVPKPGELAERDWALAAAQVAAQDKVWSLEYFMAVNPTLAGRLGVDSRLFARKLHEPAGLYVCIVSQDPNNAGTNLRASFYLGGPFDDVAEITHALIGEEQRAGAAPVIAAP